MQFRKVLVGIIIYLFIYLAFICTQGILILHSDFNITFYIKNVNYTVILSKSQNCKKVSLVCTTLKMHVDSV